MKKQKKAVILTITLLVIIFSIILIHYNTPLDKQKISTQFSTGKISSSSNSSQLNFGQVTPGQEIERNITITNDFQYQTITTIKSSKAISKHITVSENNFILQPNKSKIISFYCVPKINIAPKEYHGYITIITKKI